MRLTSKTLERCGVPPATARTNLPFIRAAMREFDITTPQRARMFLAQVLHESMRLTRFEEIASGSRYEGNKNLGNTEPGDGVRFKGRGPIQITGRWNYTHFGSMLKLDLVRHPEWAAEPRHGWRLAAAYFEDRGCNEAADRGDFREVTRRINAGLLGLEERERYYQLLSNAVLPGGSSRQRRYTREEVLVMTRRLSLVRAKATGKPYLAGARTRFGARVKRALRGFQADHGLDVDGIYGPKTMQALARAAKPAKRDHAVEDHAGVGATPPMTGAPHTPGETRPPTVPARTKKRVRAKLPALVAEVQRLDAETNRVWDGVVAAGSRRRRMLDHATDGGQIGAILLRIEAKLERLVDLQRRDAGDEANTAPAAGVEAVSPPPPAHEVSVPSGRNGEGADQSPRAGARRRLNLEDLSDAELGERIERLEQTIARFRAALIRRYARAESLLEREVKK